MNTVDDLYEEACKILERLDAKSHLCEWEVTEAMRLLRILHGDGVGFKLEAVQLGE